jgi:hypothetical protein
MADTEKIIDKLIDTATDGLMAVGKFLDGVEKIAERWEKPTYGMRPQPDSNHVYDTDGSRTIESLRSLVSDLERQQAHDVARLEEARRIRPQARFKPPSGSREVWFLNMVAPNVDGTDVIVKDTFGREERYPLDYWLTWEVV